MKRLIKPEFQKSLQAIKRAAEVREQRETIDFYMDFQKVDDNYYKINSLDSFSVIFS